MTAPEPPTAAHGLVPDPVYTGAEPDAHPASATLGAIGTGPKTAAPAPCPRPFPYFGSKTRVAGEILALLPGDMDTSVELFAGSGILTLRKPRCREEHLNDINDDVVTLFRLLRDPETRDALCGLVALTPYAESELAAAKTGGPDTPLERARRFLVRQWFTHAGNQRQSDGWRGWDGGNTPQARVWQRAPERLATVAERLRGVIIHRRDATAFLERVGHRPEVVAIADPPYPRHAINSHGSTYAHEMSDAEHRAFATACRAARCRILVTMAAGTLYDAVLADWRQVEVMVRGYNNARRPERVFMNYAAAPQGRLL